jgi:tetratricopeptide (TPR) repeat protein
LEAAIQKFQEAVDLTPLDHPDQTQRRQNLALSLTDQFQRSGDLKDLEATIRQFQEAVDQTPMDHPKRAGRLQCLAVSFVDRFRRLEDLKDLEAALQTMQEALDLILVDHPDRPRCLQNLAALFGDRYQRLRDVKDLETSRQIIQEAVELTPSDHCDRANYLQSLAVALSVSYKTFRQLEDLQAVHAHYSDSFKTLAPSNPELLWHGALKWALFSEEFQPEDCATAYSAAFSLLPDMLWIGHSIPTRHNTIHRLDIGNTASAATRTCIKLSDLTSAVELIEQGVATTFQQMLQLKPDLDLLPPEQADDLQRLSLALYSGTAADPSSLALKRRELLQNIRKQPNLEYFLLPKPYKVLCHASKGGPVVILNSHKDGCDGIIIPDPTSEPLHVAIPNATLDLLKSQQKLLKELLGRCSARNREESASTRLFGRQEGFSSGTVEECFTDLLTWLWNNVVNPVYQVLATVSMHKAYLV